MQAGDQVVFLSRGHDAYLDAVASAAGRSCKVTLQLALLAAWALQHPVCRAAQMLC
jgi:hypothetical protein